jgi:hypothetical protein
MVDMEPFYARGRKEHAESVARGEHDTQCEYEAIPRWFICNCHKRARIARGMTTPPELEWQYPVCLGCNEEVDGDPDGFNCERCAVTWSREGHDAEFTDDHGDLWAEINEAKAAAAAVPDA